MIESTGRSGRTSDATTPKVPMVLVSCHRVSTCVSPVSIRAGQPAYCVTRDMAAIAAIRGSTVVVYMIKGGLSSIPNPGSEEGCSFRLKPLDRRSREGSNLKLLPVAQLKTQSSWSKRWAIQIDPRAGG